MAKIYGIPDTVRILKKLPYIPSKRSPKYRGAIGELKVLKRLSELDDDYHIFCGIRMGLSSIWSQIDFVVVSKRGIVSIEVKNWSDEYLSKFEAYMRKYGGRDPYSQTDNSGKVLWLALKTRAKLDNPPVRKVLLATHGNMQYDSEYKFVNVKDLENINYFIQTRYERLSDEEVQKVIEYLKRYISN